MWAATVETLDANPVIPVVFLVVFFPLWFVMMGTYIHFLWCVAPSALLRWAEAGGYQVIERRHGGIFDRLSFAGGTGHHVYRIVARDREGREYRGLVRVGTPYWICTSASRCPVEVRWE